VTASRRSTLSTSLGGRDGIALLCIAAFAIPWVGLGAVAGGIGLALFATWPETPREGLLLGGMLVLAVVPSLAVLVIGRVLWIGFGNARRRAWFREHGEALEGRICSVTPTGRLLAGNPIVTVVVAHTRGNGTQTLLLLPALRDRLTPEAPVLVRVHPEDAAQILVDLG
jgi:hypothetical protein